MRRKGGKNYLAGTGMSVLWWGLLVAMVLLVEPEVVADFPLPGSYGLFFGLVFLAVFFLSAILLANKRRGALLALGVVVWGYMRLWEVDSWLNAGLLALGLLALEWYWTKQKKVKI